MAVDSTTILAHGDLDGMVSTILLLRRLPSTTAIKITNGERLGQELERMSARDSVPAAIFVVDLPLISTVSARVRAAITALAESGCEIFIYDHHLGWDSTDGKAIRRLCKKFTVCTKKTTAAAIVWACFLDGEAASQRWLKLLAEKDRSAADDIRCDFGFLAALMQRQHRKLQDKALREFAGGRRPSERVQELADWYYTDHRAREMDIASRAEVLTTRSGRTVAWLDVRCEEGHVMAARDAIQQHGADLAATVIAKGILLGGVSIDEGVDLTPIHGEHKIDGVRLAVAGHKSPVRISPVTGAVDASFISAVRKLIAEQL